MTDTRRRRAVELAAAPFALAGLAAVEYLSYRSLKRYGEGIDGIPTLAWEEFPEVPRSLLDKLTSFDAELGWCPQPNVTKQKDTGDHLPGEEVKNVVEYSTDEYGSRVCLPHDRSADEEGSVSTYGDSYCFCRGVGDDETFQHFLSERRGTHVRNYGAGNYGFDQALLRLKRQYDDDPTDHVCMVVTASSIARILSVWKHYQEFGNVLAVKPRYRLDDGSLRYVESPVDEKEDLLDLESDADYLRTHDHHYDPWFLDHLAEFPYAGELLSDPDRVRYVAYSALADVESRLGASIPGIDVATRLSRTETRLEQEKSTYHDRLYDTEADLFRALVGEFVDFAEKKEFTPVFVMVQQLRYAAYEADHGPVYGDFVERLDDEFDDLVTVDIGERLDDGGDVESLYVRAGEGGHYSAATNERIAEILDEEVLPTS